MLSCVGCGKEQKPDSAEESLEITQSESDKSEEQKEEARFEYENIYDIRINSTLKNNIHYVCQTPTWDGIFYDFADYEHKLYLKSEYSIPYLKSNDIVYIEYPVNLPDNFLFFLNEYIGINESSKKIEYESFKQITKPVAPKENEDGSGYYINLDEYELDSEKLYGISMHSYWKKEKNSDLEDLSSYYFMFGISDEDKANITDITKVE